jgi:hypothetical protein
MRAKDRDRLDWHWESLSMEKGSVQLLVGKAEALVLFEMLAEFDRQTNIKILWALGWNHFEFRNYPWPYFVPSLMFVLFWLFVPPLLLVHDVFSMIRSRGKQLP